MKIRVLDIEPILTALKERPHEFMLAEHTLDHKPSKYRFWVSSGFWFYGIWEIPGRRGEASFGFWQKVRFHRAFVPFKRAYAKRLRAGVSELDAEIHSKFSPLGPGSTP